MSKNVLIDTGYWIGLVDSRDQYHDSSIKVHEFITEETKIIPWPTLYETLRTNMARNYEAMKLLEREFKKTNVEFLSDSDYREKAFELIFEDSLSRFHKQYLSLCDGVIREILEDANVKIDYFVTYNKKDFHDICEKKGIEIIDQDFFE